VRTFDRAFLNWIPDSDIDPEADEVIAMLYRGPALPLRGPYYA